MAADNNLGGADFFNAGTAGNGYRNRALLQFDFNNLLPPGAVITSAELTLQIVRQPRSGAANSFFGLRPVLQSWGEGGQVPADANSPGLGAPAVAGEATWNAAFVGGSLWPVAGGNFSEPASAYAPGGTLGEQLYFRIAAACRHVSQEAVQLHGGMGMTDELKISHSFRRLTIIAQQFGDAEHHLARFASLAPPFEGT